MLSRFRRNTRSNISSLLGVGYVIIPKEDNIDRNQFVEQCYRTSTILLLTSDGQQYENVSVNKGVINNLEFPEEFDQTGSKVIYGFSQNISWPVILGVLEKKRRIFRTIRIFF